MLKYMTIMYKTLSIVFFKKRFLMLKVIIDIIK